MDFENTIYIGIDVGAFICTLFELLEEEYTFSKDTSGRR